MTKPEDTKELLTMISRGARAHEHLCAQYQAYDPENPEIACENCPLYKYQELVCPLGYQEGIDDVADELETATLEFSMIKGN